MKPTDDELEAMAVLLEAFGTRTGLKDAAAAMLRACKTGDAPTDERVKALEAALQTFIYETTHLSPIEDDGSHWCKISAECLEKGRAALRDMDATP